MNWSQRAKKNSTGSLKTTYNIQNTPSLSSPKTCSIYCRTLCWWSTPWRNYRDQVEMETISSAAEKYTKVGVILWACWHAPVNPLNAKFLHQFLASERSERDTLRSVQSRIVYILLLLLWYVQNFILITRKEGGA